MVLADVINIVSRSGGAFASRWAHVVVAITWIGLLYYFNFVQVPSFAEMDAAARNNAIDKLASRALWWFRWAAAATVATGISILLFQGGNGGKLQLTDGDYWKSTAGMSIATGILLALTMFLNVWLVIWPNQKKVIANARNVQAGGEPDPAAAAAGRKSALASRQNTIFSFAMIMFMVGTSHFFLFNQFFKQVPSGSDRATYWIIAVVIWALFELNALGVFGTKPGGTRWIYDTHQAALWTGGALVVIYYVLFYLVLKN
jgi:uncharacterized membrane protein